MTLLNTVQIIDGDGYRVINESDFIHGQHELYGDSKLSNLANLAPNVDLILESKKQLEEAEIKLKDCLEQLQNSQGEFTAFQNNIDAMKARIAELEVNSNKTDKEEPKTTKAK
ncbi:hypothetical protein [Acinetobacter guillouiae]|uniref:hypothetical protein n=1 Tax=Acinetobacter guillouiae TaxID=106649 RepID=UPI002E1EECDC